MARREIVRAMKAGVRLIEVVHDQGRTSFSRYAITTLRHARRLPFENLRAAREGFRQEVAASQADERVGPYVNGSDGRE